MKHIVTPLLLVLISVSSYGQKDFRPGFIITSKGDTLRGQVEYKVSNNTVETVKFKSATANAEYTIEDILGFGYAEGKAFTVKDIPIDSVREETAFLEMLVKGKVSLYRHGEAFFLEKDKMYPLIKEEKEIPDQYKNLVLRKRKFAGILNALFVDCSTLREKTMRAELGEKSLVKLTTEYNECVGAPFTVYKKNKAFFTTDVYAIAGASAGTFQFTSGYYPYIRESVVKMKGKIAPSVGVGVQISQPRSIENLSFTLEGVFLRQTYNEEFYEQGSSNTYDEEYTITYSRFKIPLGFKYLFSSAPLAPYIRVGYCFNFFFGGKGQFLQETTYGNGNTVVTDTHEELSGFKMGQVFGSLGAQKKIGKLNWFAELRIELIGGRSNSGVTNKDESFTILSQKSIDSVTGSCFIGLAF